MENKTPLKYLFLAILLIVSNSSFVKAEADISSDIKSYNGHLYEMCTDSCNWIEAQSRCAARGGHLVTITSAAEQAFVHSIISEACMIGLSDADTEGSMKWVTGEPTSYTNFAEGEPNNQWDEDYCLMLEDGFWNDGHLERENWPYVCEWDRSDIPVEIVVKNSPFKHTLDYYAVKSSSEYNPELAYDLMRLAWDAYGSNTQKNEHNVGTEDDIKQDYQYLGLNDSYYSANYSRWDYNDYDYCAYTFASKNTDNGEQIVAITIRGTVGGLKPMAPEWMSNVFSTLPAVDSIGWHQGFYKPAKDVLDALSKKNLVNTSKTKYFITGHSRGAGIGNVLAVLLMDKGVPKENLYDYNFACPDTKHDALTTDWTKSGKYNNIFNINAANDLVGVVPGILGNIVDVSWDSVVKPLSPTDPSNKRSLCSWGKYGRTLFYSFDWNSNGKSQVNVLSFVLDQGETNPHQPSLYYEFLSKMNKVGSFKTYAEMKLVNLSNNIYMLNSFMGFCPVNMTVVDGNGVAIVSVTEGKVAYHNNYSMKDAIVLTDGDFKAFFVDPSIECKVQMEATGNDTMAFVSGVANLNTEEMVNMNSFVNVKLEEGKAFLSEGQVGENADGVKFYTVDANGNKVSEISADGVETEVKESIAGKEVTVGNHKYQIASDGKTATYTKLMKNVNKVIIPASIKIDGKSYKITAIASNAFKNKTKLTTITIGSNVKTIGSSAFAGCKKLKTVKIGKNVTTIGNAVFSGDKKLENITMSSKLKKIGNKAFYRCTALKKITIPAKVTKIGKSAFQGCKKLKTVTIKTEKLTAKKVGSKAFSGIAKKATFKVPKKVKKVYTKWLKKKGMPKTAKVKS